MTRRESRGCSSWIRICLAVVVAWSIYTFIAMTIFVVVYHVMLFLWDRNILTSIVIASAIESTNILEYLFK